MKLYRVANEATGTARWFGTKAKKNKYVADIALDHGGDFVRQYLSAAELSKAETVRFLEFAEDWLGRRGLRIDPKISIRQNETNG